MSEVRRDLPNRSQVREDGCVDDEGVGCEVSEMI